MKKIKILSILVFAFSIANAQSSSVTNAVQTKGDPLVNGIPYSQYKAQQAALQQKEQQPANNVANLPKGLTATTGSSEKQPTVTQPKSVNVKGTSIEPIKPVDVKMPAKKEEAKKAAEPSSLNG